MRTRVPSLASLSALRIQCCHELWCWLQIQLGSWVFVAVVQAGNYSSDSTPSLGTSICCRYTLKRQKKEKRMQEWRKRWSSSQALGIPDLQLIHWSSGPGHCPQCSRNAPRPLRALQGWSALARTILDPLHRLLLNLSSSSSSSWHPPPQAWEGGSSERGRGGLGPGHPLPRTIRAAFSLAAFPEWSGPDDGGD